MLKLKDTCIQCLPNLCCFWCSYARRDVLPLGKFTVNLSGCPRSSAFTEHLYRLIQQLVPAVSIALGERLLTASTGSGQAAEMLSCFPFRKQI